jgi:hypothetical protein
VRVLAASLAIIATLEAASAAPSGMHLQPLTGQDQVLEAVSGVSARPERWKQAPNLTIIVSVMEYQPGGDVDYVATDERLNDADVAELVRDLTDGLAVLTDVAFDQFASVSTEVLAPGAVARVSRSNQIVVARFRGLRRSVKAVGFGGRRARKDGTITAGAILLDSEFDRTDAKRRVLRTHELGHALGYNHVSLQTSIMNPRALIEFRAPGFVASR